MLTLHIRHVYNILQFSQTSSKSPVHALNTSNLIFMKRNMLLLCVYGVESAQHAKSVSLKSHLQSVKSVCCVLCVWNIFIQYHGEKGRIEGRKCLCWGPIHTYIIIRSRKKYVCSVLAFVPFPKKKKENILNSKCRVKRFILRWIRFHFMNIKKKNISILSDKIHSFHFFFFYFWYSCVSFIYFPSI